MSNKKHTWLPQPKHKETKNRNAWLALAAIAVGAVVLLGLVWSAFGSGPAGNGTPQLKVNTERLELGVQAFNHPVRASFEITNVGNGTLTLNSPASPTVLQGCCPSRISIGQTVLGPGEATTLYTDIVMHEGMGGPHLFEIPLTTNDPNQILKKLYIVSDWQPG